MHIIPVLLLFLVSFGHPLVAMQEAKYADKYETKNCLSQLELNALFLNAAHQGSLIQLQRALLYGAHINAMNEHHESALIIIVNKISYDTEKNNFYLPLIEFLLKQPDIDLDIQEVWAQDTALICACRYNNSPVVQLLLQANASVAIKNWDKKSTAKTHAETESLDLINNHIKILDDLIRADIEEHSEARGTNVAYSIAQIIRGYL